MYNLGWNDFNSHGSDVIIGDQHLVGLPNDDPLPDGDLVYLTPEDGTKYGVPADHVELVLETAQNITWHKYLSAIDGQGITYGRMDLQDNQHGPLSLRVPAQPSFLILGKAKFLGQWWDMYRSPTLGAYAGGRLTFVWSKD
jgi:hypothetical protein